MPGQVADEQWANDALREPPRPVDAFERVLILPAQDRVQALGRHLQHREVGARISAVAVDPHRHIGDLVHGARGAVLVQDDGFVDRANLVSATEHPLVTSRAEVSMFEQRGDAVEIPGIETEGILMDERGDVVDIAHARRLRDLPLYDCAMRAALEWLIDTADGRRVLLVVYSVAAVISVVTYTIVRRPWYALSVAAPLLFAPFWARWCLRRR